MKDILNKYKHAWVLLYSLIYLPWFLYLEKTVTDNYYVIHTKVDDAIPFVEFFIIPYLLWFLYISITIAYFFFTDVKAYYRLTCFLFTGMTMFLIICTLFPNGLTLRPTEFARDNFCVELVKYVYRADTPTNVLPSIHVFNSIGAYLAIRHCEKLRKHKLVLYGSLIMTVLIILATMFLKQHSIIDVITAFAMAIALYFAVYAWQPRYASQLRHRFFQS